MNITTALILMFLVLNIPLIAGATIAGDTTGTSPVNPQIAEADTTVSYNRTYDAALEGIRAMGGLSIDKKTEGWIKAQINTHTINIHIIKLTEETTRITISAQEYALPKAQYANTVLTDVLQRIKQQPIWLR